MHTKRKRLLYWLAYRKWLILLVSMAFSITLVQDNTKAIYEARWSFRNFGMHAYIKVCCKLLIVHVLNSWIHIVQFGLVVVYFCRMYRYVMGPYGEVAMKNSSTEPQKKSVWITFWLYCTYSKTMLLTRRVPRYRGEQFFLHTHIRIYHILDILIFHFIYISLEYLE